MTPKHIAESVDWRTPTGVTPSGLSRYLKRYMDCGWLSKSGTIHSYKDTVRYQITELGIETLRMKV